ncbi:MAG: nicotinamide mononucleotide transporter [Bacteroidota bacterium]
MDKLVLAQIGMVVGGLGSAGLLARHKRIGWIVGFISEVPWGLYAYWTKTWGIMMLAVAWALMNGFGWWSWRPKYPAKFLGTITYNSTYTRGNSNLKT